MGAKKISNISEYQLNQLFNSYWSYMSEASFESIKFCENLNTSDFIKFISLRNHKSRGSDVEIRLMIKNEWEKIKRSSESGDLLDDSQKKVEVKSSIITPNRGSRVTLRGFRKWEKVDYYTIVIIDVSKFKEEPTFYIYKIEPNLITPENGFTPDNQSKKARAGNINISVGISFNIGDSTFKKWDKYREKKINF